MLDRGGELGRCTVQIVERSTPATKWAWGVFGVAGDVACAGGAFDGLSGRVGQIGGTLAPAAPGGAFDVGYGLLAARAGP